MLAPPPLQVPEMAMALFYWVRYWTAAGLSLSL